MNTPNKPLGDENQMHEIDKDFLTIADYLAGELTEAEAEAVANRMARDDAFYRKAMPVLVAMGSSSALTSSVAGAQEQTASDDDEAKVKPILMEVEREYVLGIDVPKRTKDRGRWAGLGGLRTRDFVQLAASVIIGMVTVGGGAYATMHANQIEAYGQKWWLESQWIENGAGATPRQVELPWSSRVDLGPSSRMRVATLPGAPEEVVTLEGEATINVTSDAHAIMVETAAGEALLAPGRYHLVARNNSLEVRAERGVARIFGRGGGQGVEVGPGQTMRVPDRRVPTTDHRSQPNGRGV